jgi:hypothetical protein
LWIFGNANGFGQQHFTKNLPGEPEVHETPVYGTAQLLKGKAVPVLNKLSTTKEYRGVDV